MLHSNLTAAFMMTMTIIQDPAYRMMMSPPPPAGADRSSVEELVGTLRQGDCSLPVEVDPLEAAAEHYSEVGFAGRCMAIWPVPDRCIFGWERSPGLAGSCACCRSFSSARAA